MSSRQRSFESVVAGLSCIFFSRWEGYCEDNKGHAGYRINCNGWSEWLAGRWCILIEIVK